MPTYHYVCEKCGRDFDLTQSMKDAPIKTCPKELCGQKRWGKGKVKRQMSGGAGLIFKGSGFYITDYRSDSYQKAAKQDSEAAAPKKETKDSSASAGSSSPASPAGGGATGGTATSKKPGSKTGDK